MLKQRQDWKHLLNSQRLLRAQAKGQGLVEYALILVLVSVVSVSVLSIMGEQVSYSFEKTVCSLDGGEDCECRVLEKVVSSEYSCVVDLFAYTASTTCKADTELSLLAESGSSSSEYAMSYNPSTSLFEMTDSTSVCDDLGGAPAPNFILFLAIPKMILFIPSS
jgi:Flp pilus assembly pilin Flp